MKDKIIELRLKNKGYKLIAKELGLKRDVVRKICVDNGLGGKLSPYVNQHGSDEDREEYFKNQFENKFPNFIYHSSYTTIDGYFNMECRKCGHIQSRNAQTVRPSRHKELQCDGCVAIDNKHKEEQRIIALKQREKLLNLKRYQREETIRLKREEQEKKTHAQKVCPECGKVFISSRSNQIYCCIECTKKRNNRVKDINRRRSIKENGKVNWDITLQKLIKRDKNRCYICGGKCDLNDYEKDIDGNFIVGKNYPSIDHLIPVSKGGTHTWDNIKLAHHYCNTIKNNNDIYEDDKGQITLSV